MGLGRLVLKVGCWLASLALCLCWAVPAWGAPAVPLGGAAAVLPAATEPGTAPVAWEQLTGPEIASRISQGFDTVLIPVGGTEQNGPHMVVGKHNRRVGLLAQRIARELGHTLVAPVLNYVPEGNIDPPTAHMRYPGTLTIAPATFSALLTDTARSLAHQGVRRVIVLGDHGGYQKLLASWAQRLDPLRIPGGGTVCRVYFLAPYFTAGQNDFARDLQARGFSREQIGAHAGLLDTALALASDPALVRGDILARGNLRDREGVRGDPGPATVALGQLGIDRILAASLAAIRALPAH